MKGFIRVLKLIRTYPDLRTMCPKAYPSSERGCFIFTKFEFIDIY